MHQRDRRMAATAVTLLIALGLGCAGGGNARRGWLDHTPRLYPNAHLERVGREAAEMDVAECMYQADLSAPRDSVALQAAVHTLGGAAGGAALGAIAGAIAGDPGTAAAAGAALGAAAGLGNTVYDTGRPQQGYKGWTEACLRDKGYEIVRWR